jgi:hypothetical protein
VEIAATAGFNFSIGRLALMVRRIYWTKLIRYIVVSKSVANPWRDPKIAVLAGQKAVKSWIRPPRG